MSSSHRFLIGSPLLIISVFCFAFVLMQAHASTRVGTAFSGHSTTLSGDARSGLPPISSSSKPALSKLTSGSTVINPILVAATAPVSVTPVNASPQLSSSGATALQPAEPNHQTVNVGRELEKLKASPESSLNNLNFITK
jgi:preprotein translocase subunit SecG